MPVASLAISNTAGVATTTPGSVVRFTATFTNTGQAPYTGITVASNISDVLDDATPNGDQTATSGTLTLTATGISWTGSIPVGGTVTVTGTVTVNNPDTGNKLLASTITTAAAGSNCPAAAPAAACSVSVPVLVPGLAIAQAANVPATTPGSPVRFTVTITDSGQTPYTGCGGRGVVRGPGRRRRLQRRRGGDVGVGGLRRAGADLDREPVAGRHGDDHLLGDRQ